MMILTKAPSESPVDLACRAEHPDGFKAPAREPNPEGWIIDWSAIGRHPPEPVLTLFLGKVEGR